eukprot:8379803-Pyramimonas_sp.AAC.1
MLESRSSGGVPAPPPRGLGEGAGETLFSELCRFGFAAFHFSKYLREIRGNSGEIQGKFRENRGNSGKSERFR